MLNRVDIDSLCCIVGGALMYVGGVMPDVESAGLVVDAIIEAERESLFEVGIPVAPGYFLTVGDCVQLAGLIIGGAGFINMVSRKVKKWYNRKGK